MKWNRDEVPENSFEPVPDGEYPFAVVGASTTVSTNGNEMINLEIQCSVGRPSPLRVYDKLVDHPKALWRVRDFCACVGLDFKDGVLMDQQCLGRRGIASLVLGNQNVKGKRYMEIESWCKPQGYAEEPSAVAPKKDEPSATVTPTVAPKKGDGIPF